MLHSTTPPTTATTLSSASMTMQETPLSMIRIPGIPEIFRESLTSTEHPSDAEQLCWQKNGGEFSYINLPSETSGTTQVSLIYVQPIDDEWFILLSIPMNTTEITL